MDQELRDIGLRLHGWAADLFPVNRSLTGEGVRQTLRYLQGLNPELTIHSVPSGTTVFDWSVPPEWNVEEAYLEDEQGNRVIDFADHNLHLVGYSEPVDSWLNLEDLQIRLHSIESEPDAIPYVTSYYRRSWGFCLTDRQRKSLEPGKYHAVIDSRLEKGVLNYGDIVIPGDTTEEVFLSTYVCHPSMANNELSGPVVLSAIAQWLKNLPARRYTYRLVFIPETIGSIVYLSTHLDHLKSNVIAGFNVTCMGDDRCYSYLPSRAGDTLSDRAAQHVLSHIDPDYRSYTWLDRGSDERQYCSPGVDLPIASVMRSKFHAFPEYHTSLDDLSFVTPTGLAGGYEALRQCLYVVENNTIPRATVLCEPQLGKRDMYPATSVRGSANSSRLFRDILTYADGEHDLLSIAQLLSQPFPSVCVAAETLRNVDLITCE